MINNKDFLANNLGQETSKLFWNEEILNFSKLYSSLNKVYIRLMMEWYTIKDSKIISSKSSESKN